ncbi:MAG: hypothetical protein HQL62_03530 [Magnetococcales bacterium]|nr:hypothetical protein [Magnetococcales bacterium]
MQRDHFGHEVLHKAGRCKEYQAEGYIPALMHLLQPDAAEKGRETTVPDARLLLL